MHIYKIIFIAIAVTLASIFFLFIPFMSMNIIRDRKIADCEEYRYSPVADMPARCLSYWNKNEDVN